MATKKISLNELRNIVKQIIKEERILNEYANLSLADAMYEEFWDIFIKNLDNEIIKTFGQESKFIEKNKNSYIEKFDDKINKLIDEIYEITKIEYSEEERNSWNDRNVPNKSLFKGKIENYINFIIKKLKE